MSTNSRCTCHNTLVVKNLNRWFKEKWVDVSRKDKDGKHPPCGRSKAKLSGKGYPKCRPSVKVSSKTPKTSGSMSSGQKRAATKRKRAKKQGIGGKPTIVKAPVMSGREGFPEDEFGNFRLSDLSHADMFALENPGLVPVENMSPHGQMVLHSLENPPEGNRYNHPSGLRINTDLAEAINQERDARERENPLVDDDTFDVERDSPAIVGYNPDFQDIHRSEPMHIAFQLLKRELSPEARRHKLEYDKKYESSPERVKYREELNQERRRRGIYGSGDHKDVSHTQGGRLTLEGEHSNRARHFKNRGTLRVV